MQWSREAGHILCLPYPLVLRYACKHYAYKKLAFYNLLPGSYDMRLPLDNILSTQPLFVSSEQENNISLRFN